MTSEAPYGIFLLALYGRPLGEWLTSYDPEAGDLERTGLFEASLDPADALRFPSLEAAYRVVMQQSERVPLRPDGQPNRPLTAFTLEIKRLP